MKKIAMILTALFVLPLSLSAESQITKFLKDSFLTTTSNNNWIFQIDNVFLTSDEFRRGYNEFISNISPEQVSGNESAIKKQYLESYLSQYAILMKAVEDGVFESPEMQTYFRAAVLQSVFQVYFQWLMMKTHPDFTPTAEEMNAFYQQNLEQIVAMGLNSDQIRSLIGQQLTEQKMQIWMKQQLDIVKEEYRIKRNTERLRTLGFE